MPFLTPVELRFVAGKNRMTDPNLVQWQDPETGEVHDIPSWFESDGASIPPFLWPKIPIPFTVWYIGMGHPFDAEHRAEAYLHDYLCRHGAEIGVPRADADKKILRALLERGRKPKIKCYEIYAGVRIGAAFGVGKPK